MNRPFRIVAAFLAGSAIALPASQSLTGSRQETVWEQQMLAGRRAVEGGKYTEAESFYAAAVASCERSGGGDARLGLSLGQLGIAKLALGRHDQATRLIRRGIAVLEGRPELDRGTLALLWQGLGSALYRRALYTQAEHAYGAALDLRNKSEPTDQRVIASLLSDLGSVYQKEGRYAEARSSLERARSMLGQKSDDDQLLSLSLLNNLGALCRSQGLHAQAERLFQEAVNGLTRIHDRDGLLSTTVLNNLALEYLGRHQYGNAAAALASAVAIIEKGTALPRADVVQIFKHYRQCLQKSENNKEVRRFDSRAKVILADLPRPQSDGLVIDVSQFRSRR